MRASIARELERRHPTQGDLVAAPTYHALLEKHGAGVISVREAAPRKRRATLEWRTGSPRIAALRRSRKG